MKKRSNAQKAVLVSSTGIVFNVVLTTLKFVAGIVANSSAMVSDSIHSLSDILGGTVVIVGIKLASKDSDKEHPYGHERFECVVAIILSMILVATGFGIGYGGMRTILAGNYHLLAQPGLLALVAAIVSIVVKESLFWFVRYYGKVLNSTALTAEAWHHRSDAFSSVGSFAGILGARMGYPVLDAVACVIISILIIKAGFDIFRDAIGKMTDRSCPEEVDHEIREVIREHGDYAIDLLNTRLFGDKIYVDLEISADGNLSLKQAHEIAQSIHDAVEERVPNVKHCMVHMNPREVVPGQAQP